MIGLRLAMLKRRKRRALRTFQSDAPGKTTGLVCRLPRIDNQGYTFGFVFDSYVGWDGTKDASRRGYFTPDNYDVLPQMRLNGITRQGRSESAFTVAEVVVASGIIGISCISLLIALSMGFSTVQATREDLRATQIMVQKMETLRLYNWTELQASNYIKPTFSTYFDPTKSNGVIYVGQITLTTPTNLPANYNDQMYAVTVSVCWTNYVRGQEIVHNREMQTYAALYGIQNYVY